MASRALQALIAAMASARCLLNKSACASSILSAVGARPRRICAFTMVVIWSRSRFGTPSSPDKALSAPKGVGFGAASIGGARALPLQLIRALFSTWSTTILRVAAADPGLFLAWAAFTPAPAGRADAGRWRRRICGVA